MTLVMDTGPLAAYVARTDSLHTRAAALMREALYGKYGRIVVPDAVFVEVLNLLRARVARKDITRQCLDLLQTGTGGVTRLQDSGEILAEAAELHIQYWDQGLSMTDATVLVHARRLGAKVATFDAGFQGLVEVIDHA